MQLIPPHKIDQKAFSDFINEFKNAGEKLVPVALDQKEMDFQTYIDRLADESSGKEIPENWVPSSTCFLVNKKGKIYGAVNIRHRLTDALKVVGGHIGYSIRPSVRRHGYGTMILKMALAIIRTMDIKEVILTCSRDNTASAHVIQKNGGILDSENKKGDTVVQRYRIRL